MAKIAIYARVSTSFKQDYQRQVDELTNIARAKGYTKNQIDVYAESISGYKREERLQLQMLLKRAHENPKEYDCIYTSEISRIGRNPIETRKIIDDLTEKGVPVYIQSLNQTTIDANGKRNMIMNIILQVLMEYADLEAETFKTRSRSGLLRSAKSGKAGGGATLAYGYKKDDRGMLVVDKAEANVIEEIFDLYRRGNGIKVISNMLNNKRIPTRMNKTHGNKTLYYKIEKTGDKVRWSDKQVHDIIRNTLYIGERRYKGEILPAPAIISKQLFEQCQRLRESKTHRNYLTTYVYLLKDIAVCGCCGRNYFAKYKPVPRGDKVYICSSRLIKGGNCGNIGINISLIESAIYTELKNSQDQLAKQIGSLNKLKWNLWEEIKVLTNQLNVAQKSLRNKLKEEQKLLDLYLDGTIDKSAYQLRQEKLKGEMHALKEKFELYEREITEKSEAHFRIDEKKSSEKILLNAKKNRNELKGIINQFINKVIINKIDESIALATVFVSINGAILPQTLKIFLDLSGTKKKPMVFRYYSTQKMVNDPVFSSGILLVETDDIKKEFEGKLKHTKWNEIEKKNIIVI